MNNQDIAGTIRIIEYDDVDKIMSQYIQEYTEACECSGYPAMMCSSCAKSTVLAYVAHKLYLVSKEVSK